MSKVTESIVSALQSKGQFSGGNTTVDYNPREGVSLVRYHGNLIAKVYENKVEVNYQGFPSTSTSERLRAILGWATQGKVTIKATHGRIYVTKPEGKYVSRNDEWITIA